MGIVSTKLDKHDIAILNEVQRDATRSTADIAKDVGLSQSPCRRRISLLEQAGVIKRRVSLLSREKVGLEMLVFVNVRPASHGW